MSKISDILLTVIDLAEKARAMTSKVVKTVYRLRDSFTASLVLAGILAVIAGKSYDNAAMPLAQHTQFYSWLCVIAAITAGIAAANAILIATHPSRNVNVLETD